MVKAVTNITNKENLLASFNLAEEVAEAHFMILYRNLSMMENGVRMRSMVVAKSFTMMKDTMMVTGSEAIRKAMVF